MRRFCAAALLCCLLFSCKRPKAVEQAVDEYTLTTPPPTAPMSRSLEVAPSMVLRAGEYPLWFQFAADGPVLIETIEDARFSAALIPWPLAPHARFMLAGKGYLVIAANRDGFVSLVPWAGGRIGLYHFSGGEFWRQYTVGAFFLH